MKKYLLSNTAKYAVCMGIIFLTFGCMTETSEPTIQTDQLTEVTLDGDFYTYPLENLRMDPGTLSMVAALRGATAKYHRIEEAMDAGYVPGTPCVSSPAGGMGYHYIRPENPDFDPMNEDGPPPFDGLFDPTMPEALLYEMDKNGQMKLVGVEFVIVADEWDLENEMTPYFGEEEFFEAFPPEPLPFRNYQLHVWAWKHNPAGIFVPFNPNVKCE